MMSSEDNDVVVRADMHEDEVVNGSVNEEEEEDEKEKEDNNHTNYDDNMCCQLDNMDVKLKSIIKSLNDTNSFFTDASNSLNVQMAAYNKEYEEYREREDYMDQLTAECYKLNDANLQRLVKIENMFDNAKHTVDSNYSFDLKLVIYAVLLTIIAYLVVNSTA